MDSVTWEIVLMWGAVTVYAAGSVLYGVGTVFRRQDVFSTALWVSLVGLAPHTAAIAVRWIRVGHGPYLGFYEAVSGLAWTTVALLGLLAWRLPKLRPLGFLLMPLSFLTLAAAMFTSRADLEITGTLASWWLNIHVMFAKLSYGAFVAAMLLGLVYLLRERGIGGTVGEMLEKLPSQDRIDDLGYRFVSFGFVFYGVFIVSGAIWANEAWGRYWGWDPIETWSLISWLVYAAYLHTRLTLGWRGRKAAWFAVLALPVSIFALLGVPLVYRSIHGAYLLGY